MGYTGLHQPPPHPQALCSWGNGELEELVHFLILRYDCTGPNHLTIAAGDKNLPAGDQDLPGGIGQLLLVRGLEQVMLDKPGLIQRGERRLILVPKRVDKNIVPGLHRDSVSAI